MKKSSSIFFSIFVSLCFVIISCSPLSGPQKKPLTLLEDSDFDGLADSIDPAKNDNTYTADFKSVIGDEEKKADISFTVNYKLFAGDNKVYSKDLAKLALLLSTDAYPDKSISVTKNPYNQTGTKHENLYTQLGISDSQKYTLSEKDYETDKDDLEEFYIGQYTFPIDGKASRLIFVVLRGTNGAKEWASNADAGCNSDRYKNICGNTEWNFNKDHKGFNVAAKRVMQKLDKYIKDHDDSQIENKFIFITGHSRGGGVSNIIGKELEDKYKADKSTYKPFTYTFACPETTTEDASKRQQYKSIFNIVNRDDVVVYIPFKEWGFNRYGTDIIKSVDEDYSLEWYTAFETSYESANAPEWIKNFASLADSRENIYEFKKDSESVSKIQKNQIEKIYGNNKYCFVINSSDLNTKKGNEKIDCYICPATVVKFVTTIIGDPENAWDYVDGIEIGDSYWESIFSGLISSIGNIGGVTYSHDCPAYWILADNINGVE